MLYFRIFPQPCPSFHKNIGDRFPQLNSSVFFFLNWTRDSERFVQDIRRWPEKRGHCAHFFTFWIFESMAITFFLRFFCEFFFVTAADILSWPPFPVYMEIFMSKTAKLSYESSSVVTFDYTRAARRPYLVGCFTGYHFHFPPDRFFMSSSSREEPQKKE